MQITTTQQAKELLKKHGIEDIQSRYKDCDTGKRYAESPICEVKQIEDSYNHSERKYRIYFYNEDNHNAFILTGKGGEIDENKFIEKAKALTENQRAWNERQYQKREKAERQEEKIKLINESIKDTGFQVEERYNGIQIVKRSSMDTIRKDIMDLLGVYIW